MKARLGFTLVEMAVALAVLAILAHIVANGFSAPQTRMREANDAAVIDAVKDAADRFRNDTGRLPRAVKDAANSNDAQFASSLTLCELWRKPDDLPEGNVIAATSENLCVPASEKNSLADKNVFVRCGWCGPYLALKHNAVRLRDGYGNRMENADEAGANHLFAASGAAATEGEAVRRVKSGDAEKGRSTELAVDGALLVVNVAVADANGAVAAANEMDGIKLRWYAPCGGAVTGGVVDVVNSPAILENLPPCTIVLKAKSSVFESAPKKVEWPVRGGATVDMVLGK
ncbi:MAG: prepilin-type N-terminal cleavage/methylation domain-containing protein [Kiritimatiellae bacterium]|nr:prepilin-type N-terminal cleavage/methylation domain-containing protein [Kiritimatiellia bacterium]